VGEITLVFGKRGALGGGGPGRKHLHEQSEISNNEVVMFFDPTKLVYEVKSSSWTNVGGEDQEDTYSELRLAML
jgi:hypothetical protein